MPIYEYQCDACGHILDALQKFDDASLKKCPDCGKPKLKRLLSAPMFLLKGTGWYETDFKSDKERRKNLADRPEKEDKADGEKKDGDSKDAEKKADKAQTQSDSTAAAGKDAKPEAKPAAARPRKTKAWHPARKSALRRSRKR